METLHFSQVLAVYLINAGAKDDAYFEELAKYARKAIEENPPVFWVSDAAGNYDPKTYDPAFLNWCSERNLEASACMKRATAYGIDLEYLRHSKDRRAIPIFRTALGLHSDALVSCAVGALAELNDVVSIPIIARMCARFSPRRALGIGYFAVGFKDSSVQSVFDACVADREERNAIRAEWRQKH
ncbi:MAG: hypothetical protein H7Y20_09880 [Bryobacteraceae bacterium]|nr:hypothetical protein [Bryobacteraceae bacterium]